MKKLMMPADSTLPASSPSAAASQDRASTYSSSRPAAANHSGGEAVGRNPHTNAAANTTTAATALRATLATTCPVSTDDERIGSVCSRSIMPSCMSLATDIAVVEAPYPTHSRMMPGTT